MASIDSILKRQLEHLSSLDNKTTTISDAIQYIEITLNETNRLTNRSNTESAYEENFIRQKEMNNSLKIIELLSDIKNNSSLKSTIKDTPTPNEPPKSTPQKTPDKYDVGSTGGIGSLIKKSSAGNLLSLKQFATNVMGVDEKSKLGKYLSDRESFKQYAKQAKKLNPNYDVKEDPRYKEFKTSSAIKKLGTGGLSLGSNKIIQEVVGNLGLKDTMEGYNRNKEMHQEYASKVIEQNPELLEGKDRSDVEKELIKESKSLTEMKRSYNDLFDKLSAYKDISPNAETEESFKLLSDELSKLRDNIQSKDKLFIQQEIPSVTPEPQKEDKFPKVKQEPIIIQQQIEHLSDTIKESTDKSNKISTDVSESQQEDNLQKIKTFNVLTNQLDVQTKIYEILKKGKFGVGDSKDEDEDSSLFGGLFGGKKPKGKPKSPLSKRLPKKFGAGKNAVTEAVEKVGPIRSMASKASSAIKGTSIGKFASNVVNTVKSSTGVGKIGGALKSVGTKVIGGVGNKLKGSMASTIGTSIAKRLPTAMGEVFGKSIPIIGAALGVGEGISRLMKGDVAGAGLAAVSGLGSAATAIPATVALLANDVYEDVYGISPLSDPMVGDRMTEIKTSVEEQVQKFFTSKAEEPEKPKSDDSTDTSKIPKVTPEEPEKQSLMSSIPEFKMPEVDLSSLGKAAHAAITSGGNVSHFAKSMDVKGGAVVDTISSKITDIAKSELGVDTSNFSPENKELAKIYDSYNKQKESSEQQQSLIEHITQAHDVGKKIVTKAMETDGLSAAMKIPVPKVAVKAIDTSADVIRRIASKKIPSMMGKVVGKSIPFLGAALGVGEGEGISRLVDGDIAGAGLAAASGFGSAVTAVPLSVALMAKDIYKDVYQVAPENDPMVEERMIHLKDIVGEEVKTFLNKAASGFSNKPVDVSKPENSVSINGEPLSTTPVVYPNISSSVTPESLTNVSAPSNPVDVSGVSKMVPENTLYQPLSKMPEKPKRETANIMYETSVKTETAKSELNRQSNEPSGNNIVNAPTNVNNNSTTVQSKTVKNNDRTVMDYFQNRFNFNG
jgi:hypothetical protein